MLTALTDNSKDLPSVVSVHLKSASVILLIKGVLLFGS